MASVAATELRELGQEYRMDWSDFDGRVLKRELNEIADKVETELATDRSKLERVRETAEALLDRTGYSAAREILGIIDGD